MQPDDSGNNNLVVKQRELLRARHGGGAMLGTWRALSNQFVEKKQAALLRKELPHCSKSFVGLVVQLYLAFE